MWSASTADALDFVEAGDVDDPIRERVDHPARERSPCRPTEFGHPPGPAHEPLRRAFWAWNTSWLPSQLYSGDSAFLYDQSGFVQEPKLVAPASAGCLAGMRARRPHDSRRDVGATKTKRFLGHGHKPHARGRTDLELLPGGSKTSGLAVDAKNYDLVGLLVRRQQPRACRIDGKVTRRFPFTGTSSIRVSVPFAGAMEKTAMLSRPRFEA